MKDTCHILLVMQVDRPFLLPSSCYKADNPFVAMLPFPEALLEPFASLLLLLCGKIQENPRPGNKDLRNGFRWFKRQLSAVFELKLTDPVCHRQSRNLVSHETVSAAVTDITTQLKIVENRVDSQDLQQRLSSTSQSLNHMQQEAAKLCARLDEAEDRSRRDNLLFYGITDDSDESARQSEGKVIAMACDRLDIRHSSEDIARAHRIGRYVAGRNRPLIAKFSSFKRKRLSLSKRYALKDSSLSMSQDFSASTRLARKKLVEFGIGLKTRFKLW